MSAINTSSMDVNYPITGMNNNSQGFRDNFSSIKDNLDNADIEITDLQNKSLLKSAISGSELDNNMNNTLISNALTHGFRRTVYNLGSSLSGNITINCKNGDIQYGTVTGNLNLGFINFGPGGTWSIVELYLTVASSNHIITFPSAVSVGTETLENYLQEGNSGNIRAIGANGTEDIIHLIFSTIDCGTTISVASVNRPRRATQISTLAPTSSTGVQGDQSGAISADANNIYLCTNNYDGTTVIWKRIPLTTFVPPP